MHEHMEKLIGLAIVGIIVAIVIGLISNYHDRQDFMADCTKDHKPYECQVMWTQAHPPVQEVRVYQN